MSSANINDVLLFILYVAACIKTPGIKVFKPTNQVPQKGLSKIKME
jgi:hypothetical protein